MNRRIKKKLEKRFRYRKFHNYYIAKLVEKANKYSDSTINSDSHGFDMVYIVGKNVKHPHKLCLFKNCYPTSMNNGAEEKEIEISFNAHKMENSKVGQLTKSMKNWMLRIENDPLVNNIQPYLYPKYTDIIEQRSQPLEILTELPGFLSDNK